MINNATGDQRCLAKKRVGLLLNISKQQSEANNIQNNDHRAKKVILIMEIKARISLIEDLHQYQFLQI